jgi:hypothetical protein
MKWLDEKPEPSDIHILNCWFKVDDKDQDQDQKVKYYILGIYSCQVFLYIITAIFYFYTQLTINKSFLLTQEQAFRRKRFLQAFYFVIIHLVVFIVAFVDRCLKIFAGIDSNGLKLLKVLIYNTMGLYYFGLFFVMYMGKKHPPPTQSMLNTTQDQTQSFLIQATAINI